MDEICVPHCPQKVKVKAQSCQTPSDPMGCNLPGSSVHGIFQARVLEWVAISFPTGSSRPRDRTCVSHIVGRPFTVWATREVHRCEVLSRFSHIQLFVTLWTAACQALLSMGFSRQEYWSGLPCPSPGDLPHPGMEPESLMSPALAGGFFATNTTWEAPPKWRAASLTNLQ